jgi:hypothetical protein
MQSRNWLLALSVLLVCSISVSAQDEQVKKDLMQAIGKLTKKDVVLVGSIEEEKPQSAQNGVAGITIRSAAGSLSGMVNSFTGEVELIQTSINETVAASKDSFPSVKAYRLGDKNLTMQTHTDEPFSVSATMDQLCSLLDWESLAGAVNEASRLRVTQDGNNTSIRVVLNNNLIPVKSNTTVAGAGNVRVQVQGGRPQPSVIDLVANFDLNPSQEIVGIGFSLQYDDPMQAMVAKAMKGGAIGGIGVFRVGGATQKDAKADRDDNDPLGKLCKFSFKIAEKPSAKTSEFLAEARALLKSDAGR